MDTINTARRIMIELDTLLDTRLGVMAQSDILRSWIEPLLEKGYRKRQSDHFPLILPEFPQSAYEQAYSKRNEATLRVARPTRMVGALTELTDTLEKKSIGTPFDGDVIIDVNTYPYVLNDSVKTMLRDIVSLNVSISTVVHTVSYAPIDITPQLLDEHYAAFVIYDIDQWLQLHATALMEQKIPTVTLMTPARYIREIPTDKDCTVDERGAVNPFALFEESIADLIAVNFLDTEYFSMIEV